MNSVARSIETVTKRSGRIPRTDRIQRLTIGALLMTLTLTGLSERADWRSVLALVLQIELLVTGLAGWCPIYWSCPVAWHETEPRSGNEHTKSSHGN